MKSSRRSVLTALGTGLTFGSIVTANAGAATADKPKKGSIRKLGHSLLSNPPGGYAEEDIREDGQYAVLGSFFGEGGSFLVDISNPRDPTEVHNLSSSAAIRNADVAFDPRDGLYYRSQEPNVGGVDFAGVEVVDYGYSDGSETDPQILAEIDAGPTHNVFPHPTEPVLYSVNEHVGTSSMDIWNVEDPENPEKIGEVGPTGGNHDLVVDPDRELGHAAFISDALGNYDPERDFAGYIVYDMSDPRDPEVQGKFDYADAPDYTEIGTEGFQACHYADFDPDRGLAIVGDEIGSGIPGGKHVFDIGWGDGSPSDPTPIGFTHSPNAEKMGKSAEDVFDWTTHNHDVVSKGSNSLLVSGDYHEGTVVYDITDPTDPTPTDRYQTDDGATDEVNDNPIFDLGEAPMAWGANYSATRDLTVTSDFFTGVYTFKVTPDVSDKGRGNG